MFAASISEILNLSEIRRFFHGKTEQETDIQREKYIREYASLLQELSDIRGNFNFTEDEPASDALIYEENAALCRLGDLIRRAKEEHITVSPVEFSGRVRFFE